MDKIKKIRCKQCAKYSGENSVVKTPIGSFCCYACAIEFANEKQAKAAEAKRRRRQVSDRAVLKARKNGLKTRSELIKEAQKEFNAFIRTRDADQACISCGSDGMAEVPVFGGVWDAGHYLSVGSHPELRFNEDNCHKQCKRCNAGAGKYARSNRTVSQEYRVNLIKKIGIERVEALEGPQKAAKLTMDDLRNIKITYAKKKKELVD